MSLASTLLPTPDSDHHCCRNSCIWSLRFASQLVSFHSSKLYVSVMSLDLLNSYWHVATQITLQLLCWVSLVPVSQSLILMLFSVDTGSNHIGHQFHARPLFATQIDHHIYTQSNHGLCSVIHSAVDDLLPTRSQDSQPNLNWDSYLSAMFLSFTLCHVVQFHTQITLSIRQSLFCA